MDAYWHHRIAGYGEVQADNLWLIRSSVEADSDWQQLSLPHCQPLQSSSSLSISLTTSDETEGEELLPHRDNMTDRAWYQLENPRKEVYLRWRCRHCAAKSCYKNVWIGCLSPLTVARGLRKSVPCDKKHDEKKKKGISAAHTHKLVYVSDQLKATEPSHPDT